MNDQVIVWVHGDTLNPFNPALTAHPQAPALFVWDDALLEEWQISLKRIMFMYECLLELPVTIRRGAVATELLTFAEENGATHIVTTASPSARFRDLVATLRKALPVTVLEGEPFLDYDGQIDLKRFSRYWAIAQRHVFE